MLEKLALLKIALCKAPVFETVHPDWIDRGGVALDVRSSVVATASAPAVARAVTRAARLV
jgi:hypothetical protein